MSQYRNATCATAPLGPTESILPGSRGRGDRNDSAGCVVDGEVVVWSEGWLYFEALQQRLSAGKERLQALVRDLPASFVGLDVLAVAGQDARGLPLLDRRTLLEECGPRPCRFPRRRLTEVSHSSGLRIWPAPALKGLWRKAAASGTSAASGSGSRPNISASLMRCAGQSLAPSADDGNRGRTPDRRRTQHSGPQLPVETGRQQRACALAAAPAWGPPLADDGQGHGA